MVEGKALTVVGTKRSGHHAFIEWFCTNLQGSFIYLNNILPSKDEVTVKFVEKRDGEAGEAIDSIRYPEYRKVHGAELSGFNSLLFSYENHTLSYIKQGGAYADQKRLISDAGLKDTPGIVVFIRDPLNAFASFLKVLEKKPEKAKQFDQQKKAWKDHAKRFLDRDSSEITVSYNRFIRDAGYREGLAQQLGLPSSHWSDSLSTFGGGGNTYFNDKKKYVASVEALESRWRGIEDINALIESFRDEELYQLARRYYQSVGLGEEFCGVLESLRNGKDPR